MENFKTKEEYQLWFAANKKRLAAEREAERLEYWNNLKPFKTPQDIPDIPLVPKEEYETFYIPKLIAAGGIPKDQLIDGHVYIGNHRNCTVAKWNATDNQFDYWRTKFTSVFIDHCKHFQDDDGFALFVPIGLSTEEDFKNSK